MRFAILGCGAVGGRAARQLVTTPGVTHVFLRDVNTPRLRAVAASLGELAVPDDDVEAPIPDVDAIILATPNGTQAGVARAFVHAGRSVVSVSDSVDDVRLLLALDHEARRRGRHVVVGAGFSPGLTCVLARFGARSFTSVDQIHVAKAGTGGPACARQHHGALRGPALDWRDGAWVRRRGGSGRELSWFPEPIGGRDCYRAALPDALLLLPAFPDAARITARMAATRRDRLTMHLPMMRPPHAEGGLGGVRVELRGDTEGTRNVAVFGVMDRPAVAAGAVAAIAALSVAQGNVRRAGAGGLAELVEPGPFLRDLSIRGVRVAAFDGTPRSVPSFRPIERVP